MDPSGFIHPVTIERRVKMGTKALGDPLYVWQTFLEPFAGVSSRRGREHFDQATKQRFSEVVYHFRFHFDDVRGVDATMRLVDEDGQRFDIKAILPDAENRQDVIIECTMQDGALTAQALLGYFDSLPTDGTVDSAYDGGVVSVEGGVGPYSFDVTAGALPTGLSVNSEGAIVGIPTVGGAFSGIVITVTDAEGSSHALPPVSLTVADIWLMAGGIWHDNGFWSDSEVWA